MRYHLREHAHVELILLREFGERCDGVAAHALNLLLRGAVEEAARARVGGDGSEAQRERGGAACAGIAVLSEHAAEEVHVLDVRREAERGDGALPQSCRARATRVPRTSSLVSLVSRSTAAATGGSTRSTSRSAETSFPWHFVGLPS